MAEYAIGDIQGCLSSLQQLIERLNFDPGSDRLWFTGDLVNRGPDSLATLRLVRELGDSAQCVLGNHDLHLLAVAAGAAKMKKRDTLSTILAAPDRRELLDWLRNRPLAIYESGFLMVHAGVLPQWDISKTLACAAELETVLRSDDYEEFLHHMYGNEPVRWDDELAGKARHRCIVNALTRLRYCKPDGEMDLTAKGPPGSQPDGYLPWFEVPGRASSGTNIIFGHWSTLGQSESGKPGKPGIYALDTGCVWGGKLTALPLGQPHKRVSVQCRQAQPVSRRKSRLT
ncbi:MAG: symmetrical bis(5'-nucleosyl)-tetraphosphatase [Gammaproteobacteria bacterium]|nr:symmetrical bis(5'-nucleosyl)-tetraphosphatase [Gammaproteobacteria bacterium]